MGRLKTLSEWLDYQQNLHNKEIDLSLKRVQIVYQRLFPNGVSFKVISVAGTNGKGSTSAFIDNIYQQSKYKVGRFSSPHLLKYNERFIISGKYATDEQICSVFEKIELARENISLTYFEFSTLAALLIFFERKVDIAILEVGLGGRLDSTNIVDSDIAVITNIGIDHTNYLGDTRGMIGLEKAKIMRPNKPCICADKNPPKSLLEYAKKIKTKLSFVDLPYMGKITLKGDFQKDNAALAIKAVKELSPDISDKQIENGIKNTNLNGRFEVKNIGNKTIILDVAHNEDATEVLSKELAKNKIPTIAIFAALKDKNIKKIIKKISPVINKWLLVPLEANRAISTKGLSSKFDLSAKIKICENMQDAITEAINSKQYHRVIIFGSFYTVSAALKIL